jgi:hypothetical protein
MTVRMGCPGWRRGRSAGLGADHRPRRGSELLRRRPPSKASLGPSGSWGGFPPRFAKDARDPLFLRPRLLVFCSAGDEGRLVNEGGRKRRIEERLEWFERTDEARGRAVGAPDTVRSWAEGFAAAEARRGRGWGAARWSGDGPAGSIGSIGTVW